MGVQADMECRVHFTGSNLAFKRHAKVGNGAPVSVAADTAVGVWTCGGFALCDGTWG